MTDLQNLKEPNGPGALDRLVRQCWYDGNPATQTWGHTFSPDCEFHFCERCAIELMTRINLRAIGKHSEADAGDDVFGIRSDDISGKWMPNAPAVSGTGPPKPRTRTKP